ncbi:MULTISPECIES: metallophosphoesterase [Roseiflexus]|jgi:diadenosine tetraphosphatase ApaH/serine/threonine PP2A family protein phosphatase|uniref:Metallophosphoesterase n=1 Tax=Roseiflexus castenholzii (strain DSM 13941 / HLO8) TaxID=383372 RepID=A7NK83_ROSCS|nr:MULTISPECIES: metallophosphoesterase family protein [Roseiflexus]ABU57903.1 metallophosphoesterase [Roseiflexus castenholzii DSM 13941]GIW00801.1 MAG: metallophosphoesterase [Roseiflexus sp.]
MRILILSDIHSNIVALETVLSAAKPYDTVWNLGDTIGYGPRPNECVATIRTEASMMLAGNHDLACLGLLDLSDFNPDARAANVWNGDQLTDDHRMLLEELEPIQPINERFLAAHGSPREPVWEYLLTRYQALDNFRRFAQQVCLIGHSHVPLVFRLTPDGRCEGPSSPDDGARLTLEDGFRYIINPGSIGQPRNQDPRAAFAIFDTAIDTITFHRVAYDIALTQRQMRDAQLPEALIARLEYGI